MYYSIMRKIVFYTLLIVGLPFVVLVAAYQMSARAIIAWLR